MAARRSPSGWYAQRRAHAAHRRRRPRGAPVRTHANDHPQPGGAGPMRFVDNAEAAVLAAAKDMLRRGLVEGTAGNISARREDGNLVITPSSVDYAEMTLADLVVVDPDGGVLHAAEGRSPSSEMKLHLACFQAFDDVGSVIHSHPVWATMFAIAHQPIPACIDEFAIYCGGEIRCAEYAASATPEVGSNAVKAVEGRGGAASGDLG